MQKKSINVLTLIFALAFCGGLSTVSASAQQTPPTDKMNGSTMTTSGDKMMSVKTSGKKSVKRKTAKKTSPKTKSKKSILKRKPGTKKMTDGKMKGGTMMKGDTMMKKP